MARPQPSTGRSVASILVAAACVWSGARGDGPDALVAASAAVGFSYPEIDWFAGNVAAYGRSVPARLVARFYWYYLRAIWHLPPKLREREMVRFGESQFASDMIAAVVDALRQYAQRAA